MDLVKLQKWNITLPLWLIKLNIYKAANALNENYRTGIVWSFHLDPYVLVNSTNQIPSLSKNATTQLKKKKRQGGFFVCFLPLILIPGQASLVIHTVNLLKLSKPKNQARSKSVTLLVLSVFCFFINPVGLKAGRRDLRDQLMLWMRTLKRSDT